MGQPLVSTLSLIGLLAQIVFTGCGGKRTQAEMASTASSLPPRDIFSAAAEGSIPDLQAHLAAGRSVDATCDRWRMTPLMYAAINKRVEACAFLLEKGASVGVVDKKGFSVDDYIRGKIKKAEAQGDQEAEQAYLEIQRLLEDAKRTTSSLPPRDIFSAAAEGSIPDLQAHLAAGRSVDATCDRWRMTPLMYAAINKRVEACAFLLEKGASVAITFFRTSANRPASWAGFQFINSYLYFDEPTVTDPVLGRRPDPILRKPAFSTTMSNLPRFIFLNSALRAM